MMQLLWNMKLEDCMDVIGRAFREWLMRITLKGILEKQFVEAVRAAGGQALKFTSQTMNGVPDRLVLLLGGKCAFVELKAPGKQMRLLQRKRRQQLEALGFPVFCVDRPEQIRPAINALLKWNPGDPIPQGIGATIPEMPVMELPETNTVTDTETNTEEVMPK